MAPESPRYAGLRSNRLRVTSPPRDSVREQARKVPVYNVFVFDSRMRVPHRAPLSVSTNDLLSSPLAFGRARLGFREPLQEFRCESGNLGARIVTRHRGRTLRKGRDAPHRWVRGRSCCVNAGPSLHQLVREAASGVVFDSDSLSDVRRHGCPTSARRLRCFLPAGCTTVLAKDALERVGRNQLRAPRHLDRLDQGKHAAVEGGPADTERRGRLRARVREPLDAGHWLFGYARTAYRACSSISISRTSATS